MSRDAAGTYTLLGSTPAAFRETPLPSAKWNAAFNDIATELTDSLSRSGKGGMTAAFKIVDGTVALPGLAFVSETGTGFYRIGAGQVGFSLTGTNSITFTSTAVTLGGTGRMLAADMTNATFNNRFALQTSVVNGATSVEAIPNGSGVISQFMAHNAADRTNSAFGFLNANATTITLGSNKNGAGTALPIVVQINAAQVAKLDLNGNMVLGSGSPQAWSTTVFKHLAIGDNALIGIAGRRDTSDQIWITSNLYFDNGSVFRGIQNGSAGYIQIIAGAFSYQSAATVTAGNVFTPTSRLSIAAAGNVTIGLPDAGVALSLTGVVGQNALALTDGTGTFNVFMNGASGTTLNQASNHPIDIRTNNTSRMNIGAAGNITWNQGLTTAFNYLFEGGDNSLVIWKNNSRAADNKFWLWQLRADGGLSLFAENDAFGAGGAALSISRSGITVSALSLTATTINMGPAGTEWQIDSSGRLKNIGLGQPLVHATRTTNQVAGTTVIWPTASVNRGSILSTGTGTFTAPLTGTYLFLGTQTVGNTSGSSGPIVFTLTGSTKGIFWQKRRQSNTGTPDDVDVCIAVDLVAGETVTLTVGAAFTATLLLEANNTWMSIYYLG